MEEEIQVEEVQVEEELQAKQRAFLLFSKVFLIVLALLHCWYYYTNPGQWMEDFHKHYSSINHTLEALYIYEVVIYGGGAILALIAMALLSMYPIEAFFFLLMACMVKYLTQ